MILLSFDIEVFNLPKEHGVDLPFEEQIKVSVEGTTRILDCLQHYQVKTTFFCTANFAQHTPEVIKRIQEEGHEIASYGFGHREFQLANLRKSKEALKKLTDVTVYGYRQPRMNPVPEKAIFEAGYKYNSSLNSTFIPGRYKYLCPAYQRRCDSISGLRYSRMTYFLILAFVSPFSCRILSLVCARTHKHDGYFVTYFHPWEFYPRFSHPKYKIPFIIRLRCGKAMLDKLEAFIHYLQGKGVEFGRFMDFVKNNNACITTSK